MGDVVRAVGPWHRVSSWHPVYEVRRGDEVLVLDPPNVIFVRSGEQVRFVDCDSGRPALEVMRIERDERGDNVISHYRLVPRKG